MYNLVFKKQILKGSHEKKLLIMKYSVHKIIRLHFVEKGILKMLLHL